MFTPLLILFISTSNCSFYNFENEIVDANKNNSSIFFSINYEKVHSKVVANDDVKYFDTYLESYFYNLRENMGINEKGTCGYCKGVMSDEYSEI